MFYSCKLLPKFPGLSISFDCNVSNYYIKVLVTTALRTGALTKIYDTDDTDEGLVICF